MGGGGGVSRGCLGCPLGFAREGGLLQVDVLAKELIGASVGRLRTDRVNLNRCPHNAPHRWIDRMGWWVGPTDPMDPSIDTTDAQKHKTLEGRQTTTTNNNKRERRTMRVGERVGEGPLPRNRFLLADWTESARLTVHIQVDAMLFVLQPMGAQKAATATNTAPPSDCPRGPRMQC